MRIKAPRYLCFLATVAVSISFCLSSDAQLNENFDSYKDGQNLHGLNGWKGFWDDPEVCGSVTSDQANSQSLSLAVDVLDDTVNEMNNPQSGKWSLTFDQFVPGMATGRQYLLMQSNLELLRYSVQTRFDSDVGLVIDEFDSSFPGTPIVTDTWVQMRLTIDLDNDHVDQYYNDVLINSLPWSTRAFDNTGIGDTAIGAIDLFSDGGSVIYYDNVLLKEILEIAPDNFKAIRGFLVSGSLDDVAASDDAYLKFHPGITLFPEQPPICLEFEYTVPLASSGSLRALVETSANTVGLGQTVEFYNWNSEQFEEVASSNVSFSNDSVLNIDTIFDEYVHPVTGQVTTRLLFIQESITFLFPWTVSIDSFLLCIDNP